MPIEHWTFRQNVRQHKELHRGLARLLTREIQKRSAVREPVYLDFRYLLPLAQWLVEQGGYTLQPEGNNPGNVMGSGDAGTFRREKNTEIVQGVATNVPASFAKYSSMEVGTTATFDKLQKYWPSAYQTILAGGSPELYVVGLYPGKGKDYATQYQHVYLSGMRVRLKNLVEDALAAVEDDLKECDERAQALRALPSAPGFHALLQSEVDNRIGWNERTRTMLQAMREELSQVRKRLRAGESLQPRGD